MKQREMEKKQNMFQYLLLKLRKHSCIMRRAILFHFPLTLLCFNFFVYYSFFNQLHSIKNLINKKALFFFFNAIFLFLAKDSGLLASSGGQPEIVSRRCPELVDRSSTAKGAEAEQVEKKKHAMDVVGSSDVAVAEEAVGWNEVVVFEETEELGIDELNRKCEEFIQRIKNERKMEALQLLVMWPDDSKK